MYLLFSGVEAQCTHYKRYLGDGDECGDFSRVHRVHALAKSTQRVCSSDLCKSFKQNVRFENQNTVLTVATCIVRVCSLKYRFS